MRVSLREEALQILAVVGSPRSDSVASCFVNAVVSQLEGLESDVRCLNLGERPLPLYDPETAGDNPWVAEVTRLVLQADVYVLGTPDFHGAPSGILKNFLDHFWREFAGKLFGIVVASNEKGLTVQDHLRTTIRQCYAWSLPYGFGASEAALDAAGEVSEPRARARLQMMARDLTVYGRLLRRQRLADQRLSADPLVSGFMARMHSN
jgi:NAD(P)H-dependent FMN reductase